MLVGQSLGGLIVLQVLGEQAVPGVTDLATVDSHLVVPLPVIRTCIDSGFRRRRCGRPAPAGPYLASPESGDTPVADPCRLAPRYPLQSERSLLDNVALAHHLCVPGAGCVRRPATKDAVERSARTSRSPRTGTSRRVTGGERQLGVRDRRGPAAQLSRWWESPCASTSSVVGVGAPISQHARPSMPPSSMTRIRSASTIVLSRWAMTMVVQPARPGCGTPPLGHGVEGAGRLVQQEDARLLGQRAGQGNALALATRERGAAVGQRRPVAHRHGRDVVVDVGQLRRALDRLERQVRLGQRDVLADRRSEQVGAGSRCRSGGAPNGPPAGPDRRRRKTTRTGFRLRTDPAAGGRRSTCPSRSGRRWPPPRPAGSPGDTSHTTSGASGL